MPPFHIRDLLHHSLNNLNMKRNALLHVLLAMSLLLFGCEEGIGLENDTIVGVWNLEKVSSSGTVAGVSQSDTDDDPSGTVEFENTGIGETDYSYELFQRRTNSNGGFSWTRTGNTIEIFQGTGGSEVWEILSESDTRIEIEWSEILDPVSGASSDFNMVLTR